MNLIKGLACGAVIVLLSSNGTIASAKKKPPPSPAPALPEDYKVMVEQVIKATVRDPSSATIEYRSEPYKMHCHKEVYRTPARTEVWMVDVWVNGTNAYGGFTGFQPMSATVRDRDGEIYYQAYTKGGGGSLTQFGLCKRS
jgi:hypothetical protein